MMAASATSPSQTSGGPPLSPAHAPATLGIDVDVLLFRNAVVLKQLGIAFGIPLVLLLALLVALEWPPDGETLQALGGVVLAVAGILVCLLLITLLLVYRGRYQYHYDFSGQGVVGQPRGRTARINRVANLLLMLSGRPGPAGAGMLAHARQRESVDWDQVLQVVGDPKRKVIDLRDGHRSLMLLLADAAHYQTMHDYCRAMVDSRP